MPYRYHLVEPYDLNADDVFQAAIDFDVLQVSMRGFVTYEGLPAGKAENGAEYATRIKLFGVWTLPEYKMRVIELDPDLRTVAAEEGGGMVKYHHHRIRIEETGEARCLFHDEISGDVGWLTPLAGPVIRAMYQGRHKKRKAYLGLPN